MSVMFLCFCLNQAFTETKRNLSWQVGFEFQLHLVCALFRLILLSPKCSYLPPRPPDREAAVELSFLCFHEGPVGRGDKAEHHLPSPLTAGGELSSRRSLCLATACELVGSRSGDALMVGVAGGKEGEGPRDEVIASPSVVEALSSGTSLVLCVSVRLRETTRQDLLGRPGKLEHGEDAGKGTWGTR